MRFSFDLSIFFQPLLWSDVAIEVVRNIISLCVCLRCNSANVVR